VGPETTTHSVETLSGTGKTTNHHAEERIPWNLETPHRLNTR
jgi:hypothetical protein